jgi:hypothetical protein
MHQSRTINWPTDLQSVFAAIGQAMGERRLSPEMLDTIPTTHGSILADHQVTVSHVSGKDAGHKRGHYIVTIIGSRIDGRWSFRSGELEMLSRTAFLKP